MTGDLLPFLGSLQLIDSAFPSGLYTLSHGLEAFSQAGQLGGEPDIEALIADLLRAEGLASALPLVIGPTEVIIVVGAIGLPEAGINLSERRATGFRWYAVPIRGDGGTLVRAGQRVTFTPSGPGLTALVALGYARRGLTDPYEFRIDLPADATLTLRQYEYLMNLLDHTHPLGIEINTFAIRRQHVDLDGDGVADPLKPSVANTFRPFQRRRQRGETAVTL